MTPRRGFVALLAVAGALSACSPPSPGAAEDTALAFYAAVGAGDGAAACAVLAPSVAQTVSEEEESTCADALTSGDIGADLSERAAGVRADEARVAGRQAQVHLDADTVFLARSGDGWVVTAAGCDPRPQRPYDCEVAA
ncbi:hypothetical protein [Cellulomonas sp. Marseille-Q8402]